MEPSDEAQYDQNKDQVEDTATLEALNVLSSDLIQESYLESRARPHGPWK